MKNAFGCTVNDIVLATATGALRQYLQRLDALPDRPLLAACPVSVRNDETADIDSANKVSTMFVSLPTHLDDVDAQIAHIRDATERREGGASRDRRADAPGARRARRVRAASAWRAGCSAGSRAAGRSRSTS